VSDRTYNLADLFEIVADTVPDRLALVAGAERRTYRELDERATRVAHALAARGVTAGEHVAILSYNRVEWIETMIACFKLSAVPINVNFRYVADELRYVLDNADVVAVVHEPEFAPVLDAVAKDLSKLRARLEIGDEYERALTRAPAERTFAPRSSDDLYVLYTGGTTGMPKGVVWRHEDIFFAALGGGGFGMNPITSPDEIATRTLPEEYRMMPLVTAPMMHGGGQWMAFITFFGGGTMVLYCGRHFDPDAVWRVVERERCNQLMVVGDAIARPLADALGKPAADYDVSSVMVVGSGGAILSESVREQLAKQLPGVGIWDGFGTSETGAGGQVTDAFTGRGPTLAPNETLAVLDEDLRPVEPGSGVVGRLARRGHIPLAYYNDPAKTAATFIVDAGGTRWSLPGDMATVEPDGRIVFLGRGSGCINTGGEKVFPEEVEAALKTHPAVFDAVVVGVPDERYVERVAAVVHARPGKAPTLEELQAHCRTAIAGYKMPRSLRLVDEITRTPVGKPDYRWAKRVAGGG
jgi:fatty-acyl-CoA synthase